MPTFGELIDRHAMEIGDGYRAKNDELGGDGPLFLRAGLVGDGHIRFDGAERFLRRDLDYIAGKIGQIGDTVVTTKGNSTGRIAYIRDGAPTFVYSPHLSFWRSIDSETLDPGFLRGWARSREFVDQLRAMSESTDMAPYLSLRDQRRLTISLPSIQKQRAAGRLLDAFDDKIDLNRRLCRQLEELSGAVFRARFVDFEGVDDLVESAIGWIPRGWVVGSLEDVARYVNGGAFTKHASGSGRMIIRIADLNSGPGSSTKYGDFDVPRDREARLGDVLFAWSGSLGLWWWAGETAIINQHIFNSRPSPGYPSWFVYWHTKAFLPLFRERAADKATTMGHIKRDDLGRARIALPPTDAIAETDVILGPLTDRWLLAKRESATLAELRDTLLPKLISGEVRVRPAGEVRSDE